MTTCTKIYKDIPFAHRQPNHDGHCAFIHGHNWTVEITFASKELDENNFIVDFGKLKYIKSWIDENLDHACLVNSDDPCLIELGESKYFKFFKMRDCSCEGIATFLFYTFSDLLKSNEPRDVKIVKLIVKEDSKNSAEYSE